MRSFNFLCVLDLFSERWQSTLFQIFLLLITFDLEHNVAACFHRSLRVRNHHSGVDKSNVIHYRLHITSRIGSCEEKNRYHSLVATLCFEVDNRSIIHLDKILVPFFFKPDLWRLRELSTDGYNARSHSWVKLLPWRWRKTQKFVHGKESAPV